MSPRGKHAPSSPSSFYTSLGRHAAAAVAVVAVVALVIAMATRDDEEATLGGQPSVSPTVSVSPTATSSASTSSSASPAETREPLERSEVIVTVLNGTTRAGLASQTSERIVQAGFRVLTVDNAEPRPKTVIFYRKDFEPEARLLYEDFPDLLRIKPAAGNDEVDPEAMLTVILGSDYRA